MSNVKLHELIGKHGVELALTTIFSAALQGTQSTFILTGSASYLNNVCRFIDGSSDIDALLIVKNWSTIDEVERVFSRHTEHDNTKYDIVNIHHDYGLGRNTLHIKCMTIDVYEQIINFSKLRLKSYRKTSLVKYKPYADFYTTSSAVPIYRHYYIESPLDNNSGYVLTYELEPRLPNDESYIMSDLHTMIMMGKILVDGADISNKHRQYRCMISEILSRMDPCGRANALQYFSDRHALAQADIRRLINPAFSEV